MTSTRRLALEPMEPAQAKSLGDAIVLRVEVGTSNSPSRRFHAGRPVPAFTIGTGADWKIEAPGVASIHAYLRFDGHALFVATADPEDPVLVDERPAPETWFAVAPPCTLAIGGARLAIDSRISSEFPAAVPPASSHADMATRIDIEPLWENETDGANDDASEARTSRARPGKAIVLVLGAALVSAAAYRWVASRLGSPEPAARAEAPAPSAVAKSSAPEPAMPVAAPPIVTSPVPAVPQGSAAKTIEREAVDALTAGDFAKATQLYRALVETHPNQPAFKDALRILEQRSRPRSNP